MITLKSKLHDTQTLSQVYKPEFFRIAVGKDKKKFDILIQSPHVYVFDQLQNQLKELIKSRNPKKKIAEGEYEARINEHLAGCPPEEYGVWVYYPWSGRMIHILDQEEFIDLRTSANRHKITTAERDLLGGKKVGVIGLSVGQSVSVTLALERGCGELRLADFDTLELNNLNRIRTGVHNLGLYKAYSVAREIAEIDPFFNVVCYTEGIQDHTIDDFFTKGGPLDAVIDECDSVDVKILCRLKAKELCIPVLMEASDRGTLDIERFDLDPRRPIMHGWLKHLPINLEVLKKLNTPEEKLAYILPISGLETLSSRMRASMIEIGNSITTWPQLATAVTLGGAITADTCRRIFLNQITDSGRYFIDMESLVRDIKPKKEYAAEESLLLEEYEMRSIALQAIERLKPTGYEPEMKKIERLIAAATKAPSAGNSQPWKWYLAKGCLFLFSDCEMALPFEDINSGASLIANGAALENLELEANNEMIDVKVTLLPLAKEKKLVAVVQFIQGTKVSAPLPHADLAKYIDHRVTVRAAGSKGNISKDKFTAMRKAVAGIPGATLAIKSNEADIAAIAAVAGVADRIKLLLPASHFEFFNHIRWSNDECMRTGDGVHIDSLSLSDAEIIALRMVKKQEVVRLLSDWRGGQALEYLAYSKVITSSAIGLITMPDYSTINYILAGKAVQRMWLTATRHEISIQPLQAAITQFTHLDTNQLKDVPGYLKEAIELQRKNFSAVFKDVDGGKAVFLVRMSIAEKPAAITYRKQIEKVLFLPNIRL
ncbi:MAG: Rv1355c family protein [Taibaiella sp.]|nr:Rv1355c family protein [Taibaiella sp.]